MNRYVLASLSVLIASPAAAATISIDMNEVHSGPPDFYTLTETFNLSPGFTNASLNITNFFADDRAVLRLNGTIVASTGIFGPGPGSMVLSLGGSNDPFNFQYGNPFGYVPGNTGPFAAITSGFVTGLNTLEIIVNDTNTGIVGNLSSGVNCSFAECLAPTNVHLTAEVTFDGAVGEVPLPGALPLFATGIGALGLVAYRRKRKQPA